MVVDLLEILITTGFWAATIRIVSPLIFATLGELICERAGVLNLGIEGIMTMGAMTGWMWVYQGGDLWGGILFAAFVGAMFGFLHALFTVHLGLSQHVTGIGITLFASSLSYYIFRMLLPDVTTPPKIVPFQPGQSAGFWPATSLIGQVSPQFSRIFRACLRRSDIRTLQGMNGLRR